MRAEAPRSVTKIKTKTIRKTKRRKVTPPFEHFHLTRPDSLLDGPRPRGRVPARGETYEVEEIYASVLRLVFSEVSNQRRRRKTRSRARLRLRFSFALARRGRGDGRSEAYARVRPQGGEPRVGKTGRGSAVERDTKTVGGRAERRGNQVWKGRRRREKAGGLLAQANSKRC